MGFMDKFLGKDYITEEQEDKEERATGKITRVDKRKGYGFISSFDVPFTRVFFHFTDLVPETNHFLELEAGMFVEFTPERLQGNNVKARKIKVLDKQQR